jgi:hypothetical protein
MLSSGMLHHVAFVRTNVSEECITSITKVTRIGELGTMLTVTSNRRMLRRNTIVFLIIFLHSMLQLLGTANVSSSPILVTLMLKEIHSSETLVLTRDIQHNIPEDRILH